MDTQDSSWPPAPPDWTLSSREIHVWCFSLERPPATVRTLIELLSADEGTRAERFYFDHDRRRYIVAHGTLRCILSRYVASPPERLEYDFSPRGKPVLRHSGGRHQLHFNLAHSDALGLCAVAYDQAPGVDVERIRPLDDLNQIAKQFFSASEHEQLRALPEAERLGAFFNCWTRKEAYLKACGEGLARPLDSITVSLAPGEPAQILHIEGSTSKAASWFLQSLVPVRGYVGAVAVEGQDWRLNCWQWPEEEEVQ